MNTGGRAGWEEGGTTGLQDYRGLQGLQGDGAVGVWDWDLDWDWDWDRDCKGTEQRGSGTGTGTGLGLGLHWRIVGW